MAPSVMPQPVLDDTESRNGPMKAPTPIQAMSHGPVTLAGLPTFQSKEEKRQWQLEHMAGAFRIFARHGYTEGISGHISVRDPIEEAFWINPLGVHFGMLKASDMILVHLRTGELLAGNIRRPINATGFHIHAAIHKARPDVQAICHAHGIHGRAWSAFARPLEMLNQDVCNLFQTHSVYAQYGGLALDGEEGRRIADALGSGKGCILMNHGLLTVGSTVDEAAYLFRLMEKSCEVQLLAEAAAANGNLKKNIISDEEAAYNYSMASEAVRVFAKSCSVMEG
ncbi:MAG: hypothetical protein HETSPECPRED_006481 [Heterodermia speciosa]|uniref:Class II aldolase/adducin N-terminal domain-containing protein n=1 Tax=Heterodermia speciosa TaxID=116794 RepID=A0A8H3FLZ2_9LECA|nr:MAG: hypothetical protein HETSPECPRED_006481 [Heterodermia speciosa]